jgi:hypothetical protein
MTPAPDKPSRQLSEVITTRMEQLGIPARDLAITLEVTYESVRRIKNGFPPSLPLLEKICGVLDLDFGEMAKLLVATQIAHKYGDLPDEVAGKDVTLLPVEKMWPLLTDEQKSGVITMINGWVKRNQGAQTS